MATTDVLGFAALAIGILGALALTVGGLLRLVRPLVPIARRMLICSSVGGALGVAVGLILFMTTVVWLHGRDDVGLFADMLFALFIGAGLGVPVFALREFARMGRP